MTSSGGGFAPTALAGVGTGVWALWRGLCGLPSAFSTREPFGERRLARAMSDYVWRPLPTVIILSMLIGLSAGLLSAIILKRFHAELAVIPPIARLVTAQIVPLIIGIFAAGRLSVAIAVRFGAMQFRGEIDALILRGQEPVRFLLGPVFGSLMIAAPLLAISASIAALLATGLVLAFSAITPFGQYLQFVATPVQAQGVLMGVVRSYVFMLLAIIAGAVAGTAPILSLGDLEQRTMSAFTSGLILIFATFALLTLWR